MQVAAANAYGVPPSQSAQAAVAAVTAATAAAVNGQQMPPGVGGTQQAAGTAVQAALAAQQGAGLTAAAALAQQVNIIPKLKLSLKIDNGCQHIIVRTKCYHNVFIIIGCWATRCYACAICSCRIRNCAAIPSKWTTKYSSAVNYSKSLVPIL